ncbi:S-adenosyl-L-methionine-dependent methyltransferase [Choiromyces venosus 120613-1]|uniref:S-adenosyl-L-methionine-dependent methyltransferase n=1 Tax=Choiromyces venosus 120613-1 TaxID=1336337 RepID=A0A3N4KCA8_9PEZI|nr:S-adenosyl-L-methionine-dependent methyltransferase [Choiromyces venosus 120613-1]
MPRQTSPPPEALATPEYWDARYTVDPATFDWFKNPASLHPFLAKHLPPAPSNPSILHLGCGNSLLPEDLHKRGYTDQLSVDFSEVVIRDMKVKYEGFEGLRWEVMDVRDMHGVGDGVVGVAVDKGTLDAMLSGSLWDPPEEVRRNTKAYIDEVARVLKSGGLFLYITYRQPHFIKPIITREDVWPGFEIESIQEEGGMFEYFGFVMRKK